MFRQTFISHRSHTLVQVWVREVHSTFFFFRKHTGLLLLNPPLRECEQLRGHELYGDCPPGDPGPPGDSAPPTGDSQAAVSRRLPWGVCEAQGPHLHTFPVPHLPILLGPHRRHLTWSIWGEVQMEPHSPSWDAKTNSCKSQGGEHQSC